MGHLRHVESQDQGPNDTGTGLMEQLGKATSVASAIEIVFYSGKLAKQMKVDIEDVDASNPVSGYGVDSLTAVDIRGWSLKNA
ncbi:hypothetical protein N7541_011445 [Penicillium brevicompactum]|uniref:Carrier domain-containing protein n=1 Tax=Penicillium brevicompactum TaxID=5074 RepID=A0A9W9UKW4_PENBR|nr:hypothetical protein N7541_011445 [Penicillium brevicompactum]